MKNLCSKKDVLAAHKKYRGKIQVTAKFPVRSQKDLCIAYTPGVAYVSMEVVKKKNPREYTIKANTVAVISDGSSVLGLGNIGPYGALPVMEGKALLFKEFGGVDAFPICLDTQDTEEIIQTVKNIAPVFGGINLEDISAPKCFEIEQRLKKMLDIPVFHDDQHGLAIAVHAGLINALKVVKKKLNHCRVVISGAGAAGTATAKFLTALKAKPRDILICDSRGIISSKRKKLPPHKKELAKLTNKKNLQGNLTTALTGADIFIGVSVGNIVTESMVKKMNKNSIVFALANPIPEILPDKAKKAGAVIVATGRSDFPNQINNALVFPGLFRGLLDAGITDITMNMKIAAAKAIAGCVKPTKQKIVPKALDKSVAKKVAQAIRRAAT